LREFFSASLDKRYDVPDAPLLWNASALARDNATFAKPLLEGRHEIAGFIR
jgi:hypothetical protein